MRLVINGFTKDNIALTSILDKINVSFFVHFCIGSYCFSLETFLAYLLYLGFFTLIIMIVSSL